MVIQGMKITQAGKEVSTRVSEGAKGKQPSSLLIA
jgi:cold shock CspA family protein